MSDMVNMDKDTQPNKHTVSTALIVFFIILAAWTGAWLLQLSLVSRFEVFEKELAISLYWFTAQVIIWILPALWIMKRTNVASEIFRVRSWKKTLIWGFGIGGILLVLSIGFRIISGNPSMPYESLLSFFSVVIIAPVFEEFLMRGAILPSLRQKLPFITANTITALLFTLLHFPGWYFMGSLQMHLLNPLNGVLAILIVGFLCGLAAEKGKSLSSPIIVHILNNIA